MVLAIAAFLRPLVAEQRSAVPEPFRSVVEQVVLQRGADRRRRAFRAQRKHFAVVVERVHLLLDDVGDFADTAHEELGLFHDRRADVSITVLPEHVLRGVLEPMPQRRLAEQNVVHAAHGLYRACHGLTQAS